MMEVLFLPDLGISDKQEVLLNVNFFAYRLIASDANMVNNNAFI